MRPCSDAGATAGHARGILGEMPQPGTRYRGDSFDRVQCAKMASTMTAPITTTA